MLTSVLFSAINSSIIELRLGPYMGIGHAIGNSVFCNRFHTACQHSRKRVESFGGVIINVVSER